MATETTDERNLTEEQKAISAALVKAFEIDGDGHIATDKKLYETLLPDGLTTDMVKKVQGFQNDMVIGATDALASVGFAHLKKNKKVESVELDNLYIGKDVFTGAFHRTHETTTGFGADAKPVTKFGWSTGKYVSKAGATNTAGYQRVRTHWANLAAAAFSK